jgi:outer membrane protein
MKNGLLIWNVILTLAVGYIAFTQFRGTKTADSRINRNSPDTSAFSSNFRIAYFEMDSVENNFDMVKDVKAEMNKKEEAISNELNRLGKNFEQRYTYFQTQAQSGSLSEAQTEAAGKELKSLDEQLKTRKQVLDQDYNDFVMRRMKDVKTKIEDYLKDYNKEKGYAYIMTNEPGFIYYRDTVYNITGDLIRGLNDKHKNKKN